MSRILFSLGRPGAAQVMRGCARWFPCGTIPPGQKSFGRLLPYRNQPCLRDFFPTAMLDAVPKSGTYLRGSAG